LLFCDNGAEFTGQMMDLWAYKNEVKIGSAIWRTRNGSLKPGAGNIMLVVLTGLSTTGHQRNSPARSRLAAIWLQLKPAEN
jgi:hypothetical protein